MYWYKFHIHGLQNKQNLGLNSFLGLQSLESDGLVTFANNNLIP